jgi:hypothetical protein
MLSGSSSQSERGPWARRGAELRTPPPREPDRGGVEPREDEELDVEEVEYERRAAEPRDELRGTNDPSGQWHVPAIRDLMPRFWHEPDAMIASMVKLQMRAIGARQR